MAFIRALPTDVVLLESVASALSDTDASSSSPGSEDCRMQRSPKIVVREMRVNLQWSMR
ncbi:unnamed protein product [Cercospora beticola]|nr:unnamed protein product [Cercospora beticola]